PVMSVAGSAQITALTLGATTGVTYTGSVGGNGFGNGATVCFAYFGFDSTYQMNGKCGTVSAWTSTSFTVAINSTGFQPFNSSSTSVYQYFWVPWTAAGVPSYQTTQYMKIMDENLNYALVGSVASGSDFYVPDGTCTTGSLSGGGLGAKAFGIASGIQCFSPGGGGGGGSTSFSAFTGATGANTISNGDNAQAWNWKLTTTNKTGLTIGESSPSTASGTPILFRVSTSAGSTAVPLYLSAQSITNGVYMDTGGIVRSIAGGTGGIDAGSLVTGTVPIARMPQLGLQEFAESAGCSNGQPYSVFDLPNTAFPTPN